MVEALEKNKGTDCEAGYYKIQWWRQPQ